MSGWLFPRPARSVGGNKAARGAHLFWEPKLKSRCLERQCRGAAQNLLAGPPARCRRCSGKAAGNNLPLLAFPHHLLRSLHGREESGPLSRANEVNVLLTLTPGSRSVPGKPKAAQAGMACNPGLATAGRGTPASSSTQGNVSEG